MKNSVLTILFIYIVGIVSVFAQPTLLWESRYHGVIANDQPNVMAVDAAGNV